MDNNSILRFFLIDFENVKRAGLDGLDACDQFDKVIIFYSDACDTITFDIHQQLMNTDASVEYQHIKAGGKDSLDHQLSSYLGYLICENRYCEFYIVSRDRGFEFITDFWAKKNILIEQAINLNFDKPTYPVHVAPNITIVEKVAPAVNKPSPSPTPVPVAPTPTSTTDTAISSNAVKSALKDFPEYQKQVLKILTETSTKADVNRHVNKLVPADKRGGVSKAIKPLIKHYST